MTRPNLNAVALVPPEFDQQVASTGFDVLRSIGVESRWLFYVVRSPSFIDRMSELVQGALYPAVRSKDIRGYVVPLPPFNEQKRIADKLDPVLGRVDACRERLDRGPAILKRFRQSVLAAATSGALTEEWREAVRKDSRRDVLDWTRGSFMELFDIQGGTQPPKSTFISEPKEGYVRLLQIRDFGDRPIPTYIPDRKGLKKCSAADVLLGRYGASVGKVCTGLAGAYNVALAKVIPHVAVAEGFIEILVSAPAFYLAINSFQRSAQDGFNKGDLKQIEVSIPPFREQSEIVRRVEALFAYADRVEARYAAALTQVEFLTPSLLAKAFRGKLVPQDPNDEPASALLERIRAVRGEQPTTQRGRKPNPGRVPRAPREKAAMTKSRQDDDVLHKPYLAGLLREAGGTTSVEDLFKRAELPVTDFYKQLAWEVENGHIRDDETRLEAA